MNIEVKSEVTTLTKERIKPELWDTWTYLKKAIMPAEILKGQIQPIWITESGTYSLGRLEGVELDTELKEGGWGNPVEKKV